MLVSSYYVTKYPKTQEPKKKKKQAFSRSGSGTADLGWAGSCVCVELMDGLRVGSLRWPHLHVWQLAKWAAGIIGCLSATSWLAWAYSHGRGPKEQQKHAHLFKLAPHHFYHVLLAKVSHSRGGGIDSTF